MKFETDSFGNIATAGKKTMTCIYLFADAHSYLLMPIGEREGTFV